MWWFIAGMYCGIGVCAAIVTAVGAILGDSMGGLLMSWVMIVLWPLFKFRWFRRLWH